VAQVVAAGMIVGPLAGDVATVVKLFRVMLLVPVVMVISFMYQHQRNFEEQDVTMPLIPGFLLAFLVLMLLATSLPIPTEWVQWSTNLSRVCLVVAIAAAGIKTSIEEILKMGWQPVLLFVAETVFLGAFVLVCVLLLGLAR